MQALLRRASVALSVNNADTLEELAAAVSGMTALPPGTDVRQTAQAAEVLRQQVCAASAHLSLRRRLEVRASLAGGGLWAL